VSARLSLASLLLGAACAAAAAPKVMLLIDEKSLGTIPTAEVEALAVRKLLDLNVQVVDQDMVRANLAREQQSLKLAGDNRGAAALGQQFGADVMVIGEAVAKPSARRIAESNLRTYQAVVTLRAVRTDNSATIASASEDASVIGLDDVAGSSKALKAAGEKSLSGLLPKMVEAWSAVAPAAGAASEIEITVGGVDQLWKLKAIRERLRGMPEQIRGATQRSYTSGVALFTIEALVASEDLSEALVLSPPEGLKLQVLEVGPARIQLKAVAVEGG
jgi:hypothetical protein